MEPWSQAFLNRVSHVTRIKKMSYVDTGNILGGQLITRHQCHFLLHSPLYHSGEAWNTFLRNLPLYVRMLGSASQRCLHKVWKPELSLETSRRCMVSQQMRRFPRKLWRITCSRTIGQCNSWNWNSDFRASFWELPTPILQGAEISSSSFLYLSKVLWASGSLN